MRYAQLVIGPAGSGKVLKFLKIRTHLKTECFSLLTAQLWFNMELMQSERSKL